METEVSGKGIAEFPPGSTKILEEMLLTAQNMELEWNT